MTTDNKSTKLGIGVIRVLLLIIGLVFGATLNPIGLIIGGVVFLAAMIYPLFRSSIDTNFDVSFAARSAYAILSTALLPVVVEFAKRGGEHLAFFDFLETREYFKYLVDFVKSGLENEKFDEIVIFVAADENAEKEMYRSLGELKDHPNLYIVLMDELPEYQAGVEFFDRVKPLVDEIESELVERRKYLGRYGGIRLIADDVTNLYARPDFQDTKTEFNQRFENLLQKYEFFRPVPFYSVGTYRKSSFGELSLQRGHSVAEDIRIVLEDHMASKTIVLTDQGEILIGDKALDYILDQVVWGVKKGHLLDVPTETPKGG